MLLRAKRFLFLSVVQLRAVPGLGYGIKLRAVSSALHHDRQDVRVDTVDASSPAHGLLSPGDIITHVNGVPHATLRSMMAAIATSQSSMQVTFVSPGLPAQPAASAVPASSVGQPAMQRQQQQFSPQLSQQQLLQQQQQQQSLFAQQQSGTTPAAPTSFSPAGVGSRSPASMGVPALPPPVASPRGHAIYATPSLSPHRYGQLVSDTVPGDAGAAPSTQSQPPRPVVLTRASIVGEPSGGGGAVDAVSSTSAAALSSEDPRNPQAAAAMASSERPRRAPAGSVNGATTPAGGAPLDAMSGRTGFGPADASALGVGASSSRMSASQWSTPAAAAVRAGVPTASQSVPVPAAATPAPQTPSTPGPTVLHYATPAPSPFPAPGDAIGMARPPAPMQTNTAGFAGSAASIPGTGRTVPQMVPRAGNASWGAPPGSFQTPQTGPPQMEPAQTTGIALGAAAAGEVYVPLMGELPVGLPALVQFRDLSPAARRPLTFAVESP